MGAQTTLKRKLTFKGIGLHAGGRVICTLHPAEADHGIVFVRSDLSGKTKIQANVSKVVRTDLCTTLGANGAIVATVEHLMAAISGMGLHNALIEINGPEVPIMDGSSREFAEAIAANGLVDLDMNRKAIRLTRKITVQNGDKYIVAEPAKKLSIKGSISFGHQAIGEQIFRYTTDKDFQEELSAARTFGFLQDVQHLHKKGLALGGSLENAIVLDEARVLNPEGLRFKNEFVRHKVLDAMGDLALAGMDLHAAIQVHKGGHELHAEFLKKVLSSKANYEIVEIGEDGRAVAISEDDEALEALPFYAHAY